MTLRRLLAKHPAAFYPQTWYWNEEFLDTPGTAAVFALSAVTSADIVPRFDANLPTACDVAFALYMKAHTSDTTPYFWCSDTDALGQRVYVGQNGTGIEIHRHLTLTSRWMIPTW